MSPSTRKDVTIKDIAQAANVSVWLVSSVLSNRHKERRIAPASAEKVMKVAAQMGYLPNVAARQLRKNDEEGRSLMLAVITNRQMPFSLTEHLMRSLHAIPMAGKHRTFTFEIKFYNGGELARMPGILTPNRFNAAIITNTTLEDDAFLAANRLPYPVVMGNRTIPGYHSGVDSPAIGAGAAKILADTGSRLPALVIPKVSTQAVQQRSESFAEGAKALGLKPKTILCAGFSVDDGFNAVQAFLKHGGRLDGLYCLTDNIAIGACHALKQAGLRIPQDVCVVGIGDNEISPYFDPPLSTFGATIEDLGKTVGELLADQLNGNRAHPHIVEIPPHMQLRRSTARGRLLKS